MKHREDRELIALSKLGDMKAQLELWEKWEPFTKKHFFQAREAFVNSGVTLEDYMQDAYIAFVTAIQKYDLVKAEAKGSVNFSTYYYWYLMKLKNAADDYLNKWGSTKLWSDYLSDDQDPQVFHDDAINNEWNRATMKDIKDDFKKAQAVEILNTYFEEEDNPLFKQIVHFLLMGKNPGNIVHLLDDQYTYGAVRKMIDEIYVKIRTIANRVVFEPIFV